MQQTVFIIALWLMVIAIAKRQIKEFLQWLSKVRKFFSHRRRLKAVLAEYRRQYEQAATDYLRGYYYGKMKITEIELEEMWK